MRRITGDRLRGEALFILTLTTLALGVLIAHYLGWALLQPSLSAENTESWQLAFWFAQLGSVAFLVAVGGIGFRPRVTTTINPDAAFLSVEQGSSSIRMNAEEIQSITQIPARLYHLHYRHYARTRLFRGRMAESVLVFRTASGPVVLALEQDDLDAVFEVITSIPSMAALPAATSVGASQLEPEGSPLHSGSTPSSNGALQLQENGTHAQNGSPAQNGSHPSHTESTPAESTAAS